MALLISLPAFAVDPDWAVVTNGEGWFYTIEHWDGC